MTRLSLTHNSCQSPSDSFARFNVPMAPLSEFKDRLRWARERAGLTPTQAAQRLAVAYPTYKGWENGKIKGEAGGRSKSIAKAAHLFKVELLWLIEGRGQPHLRQNPIAQEIEQLASQLPMDEQEDVRDYIRFKIERPRR